jgi:hypothetical protein
MYRGSRKVNTFLPIPMCKPFFNGRYRQALFINIRHTLTSDNLLPLAQSVREFHRTTKAARARAPRAPEPATALRGATLPVDELGAAV